MSHITHAKKARAIMRLGSKNNFGFFTERIIGYKPPQPRSLKIVLEKKDRIYEFLSIGQVVSTRRIEKRLKDKRYAKTTFNKVD